MRTRHARPGRGDCRPARAATVLRPGRRGPGATVEWALGRLWRPYPRECRRCGGERARASEEPRSAPGRTGTDRARPAATPVSFARPPSLLHPASGRSLLSCAAIAADVAGAVTGSTWRARPLRGASPPPPLPRPFPVPVRACVAAAAARRRWRGGPPGRACAAAGPVHGFPLRCANPSTPQEFLCQGDATSPTPPPWLSRPDTPQRSRERSSK